MSVNDLKNSLYQMIDREGDEQVLNHIKEILEQNIHTPIAELGGQTIHEFNVKTDNGEFSTQEEVIEKFEKMFQK